MGKYKVIKKLGQGSYGTVYLVEDSKDGQFFVMKKITVSGLGEQELSDCKKEIQILSVMKHPNIIRYKRSFVRRGALCIVMEYADGGDLHQLIRQQRHAQKHFPEEQILDWLTQACLGLKHVHDHKILHRDLKTQNIFLTSNGEVRLGDFGISRVLKNTMDQAHTLVGTPYYLSPEMVNGQPYDHRSDIWSMGVVLYEMLTLQHPFNADSLQMLALKIIQGNYPPIPKQYSEGVNDLLSKMLMQDAKKRFDIDRVLTHSLLITRTKKYAPDSELIKEYEAEHGVKIEPYGGAVISKAAPARISQDVNGKSVPEINKNKLPAPPGAKASADAGKKVPVPPPRIGQKPSAANPADMDEDDDLDDDEKESPAPTPVKAVPSKVSVSKPPPPAVAKPAAPAQQKRRGSVTIKDVEDEEPDWEITEDHNEQQNAAAQSQQAYQEPSVARNTQADILKSYLEERLGAPLLRKIIETLDSDMDDKSKQKAVEKLTKGHSGLLPIVHTYVYLSK